MLKAHKTDSPMQTLLPQFSTCIGPSMYPTLRSGDGLKLRTYQRPTDMRIGDVIVYPHPHRPVDVVHRIINIVPDGVITRGDNNNLIDPYTVGFDEIKGKVVAVKRGARTLAMAGGLVGRCRHKLMLARKYAMPYIKMPPRLVSDGITRWGLLRIFHPLLNLRILRIESSGRQRWILMAGRKAIGTRRSAAEAWQIRFPYKLVIDPGRLDKNELEIEH